MLRRNRHCTKASSGSAAWPRRPAVDTRRRGSPRDPPESLGVGERERRLIGGGGSRPAPPWRPPRCRAPVPARAGAKRTGRRASEYRIPRRGTTDPVRRQAQARARRPPDAPLRRCAPPARRGRRRKSSNAARSRSSDSSECRSSITCASRLAAACWAAAASDCALSAACAGSVGASVVEAGEDALPGRRRGGSCPDPGAERPTSKASAAPRSPADARRERTRISAGCGACRLRPSPDARLRSAGAAAAAGTGARAAAPPDRGDSAATGRSATRCRAPRR